MATTFTNKLESFFDNNTPGGYIQTSINITDSELDARINQKFQNQNYLTSTSMIPASQITGLSTVATSGRYSDLIGITGTNVSISNTLTEGTKIATITINGENTDLYAPIAENGIEMETDPLFLASPASTITANNINIWNNKSDFNGNYHALSNKPVIPSIYNYDFSNYDIIELKNLTLRPYVINTQNLIDSVNSISIDNFLQEIINIYNNTLDTIQINFFTFNNIKYTISYIYTNNDMYTFCFYPKHFTNYQSIDTNEKTNDEILNEIEIIGEDNMIWEYDVSKHLLFII